MQVDDHPRLLYFRPSVLLSGALLLLFVDGLRFTHRGREEGPGVGNSPEVGVRDALEERGRALLGGDRAEAIQHALVQARSGRQAQPHHVERVDGARGHAARRHAAQHARVERVRPQHRVFLYHLPDRRLGEEPGMGGLN